METLYNNIGVIIGFLVLVLLVQGFISDKAATAFVTITLLGALVFNADTIVSKTENIFTNLKGE